jgi:DNA phosphorothioation system restriction enzyme
VSPNSKYTYRVDRLPASELSKYTALTALRAINYRLTVCESTVGYQVGDNQLPPGCPQIPVELQLRSYQQQAVTNWFANQGRGTLKMATGSGKTITALAIACQLYQQIGLQVLIIICPFRHLVTQWGRVGEQFNLQPILAYESVHKWQGIFSDRLSQINTGKQKFLTIIATNDTFISPAFQSQLKYIPDRSLIIGDEAHHLGSRQREANLPRHIGLRLALSATPERHFDDRGTQSIFDYFGNILEPEFTLKDAIVQGALVPYLYYPLFVELTAEESEQYLKITKIINRKLNYQNSDRAYRYNEIGHQDLTPLFMQRARIIGSAANKLPALKELMRDRLNTSHTLFYCGDGSSDSTRQLAAVTHLLGTELGYRVNTYTADTSLLDREKLRRQFESGDLQGLVAIRCLDEGIDIPAIKHAVILASSTNPRQFIQRRGRILRPDRGKERATLFDTIVLPPELDRETLTIERHILKKELARYVEFADLAENAVEARNQLLRLQARYGLTQILQQNKSTVDL